MTRKRWTLPIILGLITFVLLLAVLWPQETPKRAVTVAARDLGAGTVLTPADLAVIQMDAANAPADAIADPTKLAGQTLAVVRFAGEPVTARHLGPAVVLAPDERGIAIQVKADTGLAGLLRPGMRVGIVATLGDQTARDVYAKTVLEGLRVVYVSPDFQARPYTPATASAQVKGGGGGGLFGPDQATTSPGTSGTVREGVLVLAASTQPQPIRYEPLGQDAAAVPTPATRGKPQEPPVRWVIPVELLAALNAAGNSMTLTLLPEMPQEYVSEGLQLNALRLEAP